MYWVHGGNVFVCIALAWVSLGVTENIRDSDLAGHSCPYVIVNGGLNALRNSAFSEHRTVFVLPLHVYLVYGTSLGRSICAMFVHVCLGMCTTPIQSIASAPWSYFMRQLLAFTSTNMFVRKMYAPNLSRESGRLSSYRLNGRNRWRATQILVAQLHRTCLPSPPRLRYATWNGVCRAIICEAIDACVST